MDSPFGFNGRQYPCEVGAFRYKFTNHQQLHKDDQEKRTEFCAVMLDILNENEPD